jgi:DNA modification methylase
VATGRGPVGRGVEGGGVTDATWRVIEGDCTERMRELEPASIDAVVCDPPYGLEFMGKEWDRLQAVAADPASVGGFQDGAGGNAYSRSRVRYGLPGVGEWATGSTSMGIDGYRNPTPSFGSNRNPVCLACHKHKRGTRACACDSPRWDETPADGNRAMQDWHYAWALEALRVLKPGGHLLAFGGTRTYHRLACALEDAGFEIRDCIAWLYGSGFPKSLDVSKAIDKAAGAEREVVGRRDDGAGNGSVVGLGSPAAMSVEYDVTAPATPDAERWQGWGTALKPAFEPIVVARKPLERTVAANVLTHGTGALNIDGTRIGTEGGGATCLGGDACTCDTDGRAYSPTKHPERREGTFGRWPANVALGHSPGCEATGETRKVPTGTAVRHRGLAASMFTSAQPEGTPDLGYADADGMETVEVWRCEPDCAVRLLDEQTGELQRDRHKTGQDYGLGNQFGVGNGDDKKGRGEWQPHGDTGGASRFFYCPKADRAERNRGLEHMAQRPPVFGSEGEGALAGISHSSGARANHHPTVKPVELMRWLCRLVTPPHGTVLDPFTGSGTTGIAAMREGFSFVGIEREAEYAEIARARIIGDAPMFNSIAEVTA